MAGEHNSPLPDWTGRSKRRLYVAMDCFARYHLYFMITPYNIYRVVDAPTIVYNTYLLDERDETPRTRIER